MKKIIQKIKNNKFIELKGLSAKMFKLKNFNKNIRNLKQ